MNGNPYGDHGLLNAYVEVTHTFQEMSGDIYFWGGECGPQGIKDYKDLQHNSIKITTPPFKMQYKVYNVISDSTTAACAACIWW